MPLKSAVPADSPHYQKVVDIETRRPTVLNLGVGSKRHVTPTQNAQVSQIVWGTEPQQRYKWTPPTAADQHGDDAASGGYMDPEAFNSPQQHQQPVSYTHLRAHETPEHLVCRLLLEKKKQQDINQYNEIMTKQKITIETNINMK
eukprot:TRINITY_DN6064_c0_g1_i2.p1 TRINITY_DN6064_c0_g1~~TRINITY_DN6064_c0_g1_i2.p1  ORF type:complete len:145 (+),score=26.20 TRINITY_DN6064_c0_g1_i2:259-693(+)